MKYERSGNRNVGQGHVQGHKVIDLSVIFERVSLAEFYIPNTKSLSLTVQTLWLRLKFLDM